MSETCEEVTDMAEFKNRFGFEWLKGEEMKRPAEGRTDQSRTQGSLPSAIEDTLIAYGRPLLEALKQRPGHTSQAIELATALKVRFDIVISVLDYLARKGYLERVGEDPIGNDTVKLTPAGDKLLG
jgi:hypothetical protein